MQGSAKMYSQQCYEQLKMELPFGVALDKNSRWVKLAAMFPWKEIDEAYSKNFASDEGQIAKPSRLAFGALYIQTSEGFTDEQTRRHIQENPYLQYFCGLECYTLASPFDASMMTHFRKRITSSMMEKINSIVFAKEAEKLMDNPIDPQTEDEQETQIEDTAQLAEASSPIPDVTEEKTPENKGTMILDGTCCPADIHYPTDVGLLNHAREIAENIIDVFYENSRDMITQKPRTYREVARREYVSYTKKRRHSAKEIRRAIRGQLQYLRRDLGYIDTMANETHTLLSTLPRGLYRKLLVIHEVYRQQKEMYDNGTNRCNDRIVSIDQPHVRPIVRGKAGCPTEFGAKIVVALIGGYAFIVQEGWDNYNEAKQLIQAANKYKEMFGVYPKTILGDRAYPIRENRKWCAEHGIRLSGPRLGRKSAEERLEESKQIYQDGCDRIPIEGAFGVVKRRYDLDCLMTRLPDTSMTAISMGFFAANMERRLRLLFVPEQDWALDYDFDLLTLVAYARSCE